MSDRLTFTFDGACIEARRGQSLAAALTDAGQRVFRRTGNGSPRGIFCGMGICQDCLVTVDGRPNQRACMTAAEPGADVRRQEPQPPLPPPLEVLQIDAPPARSLAPDVLVVGAGAGGLNAAIAAAAAGARVVVLDERRVPGGQYFKQPMAGAGVLDDQQQRGRTLLDAAHASGAEILGGVEIWGVFPGPLLYAVAADGAPLILRPRQLVVATGAYERPVMVPGWTLPGVMTTGAAQTLWRSYRSLPGQRVAVCGSGPLNLQVALELARAGADVRLVAEAAPSPLLRPGLSLALLAAGPTLAATGIRMRLSLLRRRVPVRYGTQLVAVEAADGGELRATFRDGGGDETLALDALCMNDGFEPQNEILRLLGARMDYDPGFGQLRCRRGDDMQTSVPGVFAVGDCCGLGGAPAAEAEGRIAGAAAARACGFAGTAGERALRRALRRAYRFQARLWALHDPAPRPLAQCGDDTIVCRCEEIRLGELREALAAGDEVGAVKRATRVGMGCCQGRYCGPVVARLAAESRGRALVDDAFFAPRVPVKPVSVAALRATQEALDGIA